MKTADKDFQFGPDKCTYIVVSKMKINNCDKSELFVDTWTINHRQNGNFDEEIMGKVPMSQEKSFMYFGYVLSYDGSNMLNINKNYKRNKTICFKVQIIEP